MGPSLSESFLDEEKDLLWTLSVAIEQVDNIQLGWGPYASKKWRLMFNICKLSFAGEAQLVDNTLKFNLLKTFYIQASWSQLDKYFSSEYISFTMHPINDRSAESTTRISL